MQVCEQQQGTSGKAYLEPKKDPTDPGAALPPPKVPPLPAEPGIAGDPPLLL